MGVKNNTVNPSIPCDATGTLTFHFIGVSIDVPLSAYISGDNGDGSCGFILNSQDSGGIYLGVNFLEYAYVLYDLDSDLIGLATPNLEASGSDVVAVDGSYLKGKAQG